MLLTTLAEGLAAYLNTNRSKWTSGSTEVVNAFNPLIEQLDGLEIFVIPGQNIYNIEGSPRRGTVKRHLTYPTLILAIGAPFKDVPDADEFGVANWDEAKKMLDLQEKIEEQAIYYKPEGLSLGSVEAVPPDDINADQRNFVVATTFVYERLGCSSEHASLSLSTGSKESIRSAGIRGSIRSAASSAERQGKR